MSDEPRPLKTYVVQQPFRGVATFLMKAATAREALAKVDARCGNDEDVECVDRDTVMVYKAATARLDIPRARK